MVVGGNAAQVHKGVSFTRMAMRIRQKGEMFSNSPFETHTFVLIEGSDKYDNLKSIMREPLAAMKEVGIDTS